MIKCFERREKRGKDESLDNLDYLNSGNLSCTTVDDDLEDNLDKSSNVLIKIPNKLSRFSLLRLTLSRYLLTLTRFPLLRLMLSTFMLSRVSFFDVPGFQVPFADLFTVEITVVDVPVVEKKRKV